MKKNMKLLGICIALLTSCVEHKDMVSIDNGIVKLEFDLSSGTYRGIDLTSGKTCLYDASWKVNDYLSTDADSIYYEINPVEDGLGKGKSFQVTSVRKGEPELTFYYNLYDEQPFVIMYGGINNVTCSAIKVKELSPVANARIFKGADLSENFRLIDGEGGGNPTYVRRDPYMNSPNNMILHFGSNKDYHSLVGGGVSYAEFTKFAAVGNRNQREMDLRGKPIDGLKFVSYWDLGEKLSVDSLQPFFSLSPEVSEFKIEGYNSYKEARTYIVSWEKMGLTLQNLNKDRQYVVGVTWSGKQSASLIYGDKKIELVKDCQLPDVATEMNAGMVYFEIPKESNSLLPQLFIEKTGGKVMLSEMVLYEGRLSEETKKTPRLVKPYQGDFENTTISLYTDDFVGKLVDRDTSYVAEYDKFYIDFVTKNPVYASEKYAQTLKQMQRINLNYYYFPTVDLWYAMKPIYGGNITMAVNDAVGAVEEMQRVKSSGFLKYTTIGIRLIPDCYDSNNENGWWDDEHWRMHGSGGQGSAMELKSGHYRAPYDTSKKWAQAIRKLGGLPFIYFQTAVRSKDYAEAYPGHMLFNESFHEEATYDWLNHSYTTYDFTDADFQKHLGDVYDNLRDAGIVGIMYDYPYTGWPIYGGMDDKYSTASGAYRTIFKFAHEGLGRNSYIHERNLRYGSDISLGYIASQRIWDDTDIITSEMVMRGGLRWYKNRVVLNYDMDAKNLLKAYASGGEDGLNKMLTMSYVAASRLVLANSFGTLPAEYVLKLSRIYPYHQFPQSARPLDAFVSDYPRVYGLKIDEGWSAITFFNEDVEQEKEISVLLSGIEGRGGVGLDINKDYYVYDFWNDCLIGKYKGSDTLKQVLRKGEARQMAVKMVKDYPQVLSTDRHLLQGALELSDVEWNAEKRKLTGRADLVEGEELNIIIADNGFEPSFCSIDEESDIEIVKQSEGLIKLRLKNDKACKAKWEIIFR